MREKLALFILGAIGGFVLTVAARAVADHAINDGCRIQWESV